MFQANRTFQFHPKTVFLIALLATPSLLSVSAFTVRGPSVQRSLVQQHRGRTSCLSLVADAEMEEIHKKRHTDDDDNWTRTKSGGFLPKLLKRQRLKIHEVTTIQDYKTVVADEQDQMVCVRFYAPWCRACKAVQHKFRKLAIEYPSVKFVEVPLTKENAFLHDGLGVPSLPYVHLYHPDVGLVDERSINKKVFGVFRDEILQCYVDGCCPINWEEGQDEECVLQ